MSLNRFSALDSYTFREEEEAAPSTNGHKSQKISEYFGSNIFDREAMQEFLDDRSFKQVSEVISSGQKLDKEIADIIAGAMQNWAQSKGVTHYAHWFQPLTGRTAEKHDSFFTLGFEGKAIESFSGSELAQQEPDGSSFPGGGLRSTFEARGYTAWDPTSPAFILEVGYGKTLFIPTIFVTYGGQALDYKLPLLKSQAYLEEQALKIAKWFDDSVTKVTATLGWEQEYFLIDEALFNARPDLVMTGRTLLGKSPPKGQQLDDHYFGRIPDRVYKYMLDLEKAAHKLGIPIRTRHNEVSPGQYELAPQFEEVNIAVDHNTLLMDLMEAVALKHNMRVLLHEKPFEGVNGSGKHNNWSMSTDTGKNLLAPGEIPGKNLRFLTFFVCTIKAVYEHADLLRASVASAGNDHRLGANEAPPAIVSVFIGDTMTNILDKIEEGIDPDMAVEKVLNLLKRIPNLLQDNTDRNRTSPFAFTGNKFEIRMVGASQNCAGPMTVLNAMVGRQLEKFRLEVEEKMDEKSDADKDDIILSILQRYITDSKAIRFEGDGYSEEWAEEAERRGLNNYSETPTALEAILEEKSIDLLESSGIFTRQEIEAHHEVKLRQYILTLQIESRTLGELCFSHVLPSAFRYQTEIASNISSLKELDVDTVDFSAQEDILGRLTKAIQKISVMVNEMREVRMEAHEADSIQEVALKYCHEVKPLMDEIRIHCDRLEYLIEDSEWLLVKYRELLFMK